MTYVEGAGTVEGARPSSPSSFPSPPRGRRLRVRLSADSAWASVLLAVALALVLHLVWWLFLANSGGDIAAQDAWAEFARDHPGSAYNFAWYGGMHPVSYSVASPYLMAVLGVRTTMVVSGTLAAGLLAWLVAARVPAGRRRWMPVAVTAVALFGNAVSGRVTFALGICFALAALCVIEAWPGALPGTRLARIGRSALAALFAALATMGSPVAGLFLGLVAAALWLRRRRAAAYALGVTPVIVVAVSAIAFPFSGRQPMAWSSAILPAVAAISVLLLVPRAWKLVRLTGLLYLVAVVLAWLVPSPVGTNIGRLGLIFGGVVLVAALLAPGRDTSWAGRRYGARGSVVLLTLALITSAAWQVGTAARDAVTTRPAAAFTTDLDPLLAQLRARDADLGRVEVVPTRSHREASAIAPYLPLARGWNRQADAERNELFYGDTPLTATAYHAWLHRWAVRFVVVSAGDPDPAAVQESDLIARGLPYLEQVWANGDWTLYAVTDPTSLVSSPGEVLSFDADEVVLQVPRAGRYVVRVAASPWLSLVDAEGTPLPRPDAVDVDGSTNAAVAEEAEVPPAPGTVSCLAGLSAERPRMVRSGRMFDFVVLHAATAGTYRLAAPYSFPRGTPCPGSDS